MSKTKVLAVCFILALAFVAKSEGLKCWHCIRSENQFEQSLQESKCQTVNCPEGTNCYLEVLAGKFTWTELNSLQNKTRVNNKKSFISTAKDTSVRGCYPYKDCEISKKNGAPGCRVCKRDMCNAEPERFHIHGWSAINVQLTIEHFWIFLMFSYLNVSSHHEQIWIHHTKF